MSPVANMLSLPSQSVTNPPASRTIKQCRPPCPTARVALPIGVEPSGRDPGEIERRCAEAAQARHLFLHHRKLLAELREVAAAEMRQAAGKHRLGESLARRDADAPVVEVGALAAFGGEHLVVDRIVDQAGDDRAFALERDRDREMRNAVQEIRRAVERIDDPGVGLVVARLVAAFLAEKAVAGASLGQFGAQDIFGSPVGRADEIRRAL